jgi:hypothetical protein
MCGEEGAATATMHACMHCAEARFACAAERAKGNTADDARKN